MRRKASGAPRNSTEFDLKKDMDQDVIWGIGACAIIWNAIEATLEVSFALALELPAWACPDRLRSASGPSLWNCVKTWLAHSARARLAGV
jgi:hypothetical protein